LSPDTDAPTKDEEAAEPAEAEPRDEAREALRDRFAAELGDAVVDSHITVDHTLWVRVTVDAWRTAGQVARDHLGMRWFDFVSAIDWLPSPYGRYEDDGMVLPEQARPDTYETGVAGGDTRFQVFARVVNVTDSSDIIIKADVGDDLTVPSWVPLYDGADWHERECWEMFGLTFDGHPGLRHMYLPGDFEGNPMRKDFPLIARIVKPWPGIVDVEPMPAEEEEAADTPADAPAEDAATDGGEA
jgi:NADH-quinone oxidoreductase subunit C